MMMPATPSTSSPHLPSLILPRRHRRHKTRTNDILRGWACGTRNYNCKLVLVSTLRGARSFSSFVFERDVSLSLSGPGRAFLLRQPPHP